MPQEGGLVGGEGWTDGWMEGGREGGRGKEQIKNIYDIWK